jgi:phosphatidylglycerophosphate synthase
MSKKNIESIKELKIICQNSKTEEQDWYSTIFCRKVSIYLSKLLLSTSITANQVTLLSIVVGLVAGVMFSFGNYLYTLAGALLLQLWLILDCVDGEIARYRKSSGPSGKYMESMDHYITEPFIFVCISFGLYNTFHIISIFVLGFSAVLLMCLGHIATNLVYTVLSMETSDPKKKTVSEQISKIKNDTHKKYSKLRRIYTYVRIPFISPYFMILILIAAIADLLFINWCLHSILDKMSFNILYLYFLLFTIFISLRNIIRIFDYFSQLKSVE